MQDWSDMQKLAQEYADIRAQGSSTHPYGTNIENRTPRQREIVEEIITGTTAFLAMLAHKATRAGVKQCTMYGSRIMRVDATLDIDDLVQEGAIQIHTTFGQYDPERGSISTFLRANALVGMSRLNRQHALIRVPRQLSGLDTLVQTDATTPQSRPMPVRYIELDAPVLQDDNTMRRIDLVVDPTWRASYDACEDRLSVMPSLAALSPRYREVIERRYGLNGREPTDTAMLAREMGLTRERIRQIENRALSHMRRDAKQRAKIHEQPRTGESASKLQTTPQAKR